MVEESSGSLSSSVSNNGSVNTSACIKLPLSSFGNTTVGSAFFLFGDHLNSQSTTNICGAAFGWCSTAVAHLAALTNTFSCQVESPVAGRMCDYLFME